MNLTSRIGDYGIIGTFFLLMMVMGLLMVEPMYFEQKVTAGVAIFEKIFSVVPTLATPLASLIAALALISVFFIGLVIDLLGFYAYTLEVVSFRRRVEQHRAWIIPFFHNNDILLAHDIKAAIDDYQPSRRCFFSIRPIM